MKLKYLIILLLLLLLAFIVRQMLNIESRLRERGDVEVIYKQTDRILLEDIPQEQLKKKAALSDYYFIAGDNFFSVLEKNSQTGSLKYEWEEIFVKGVNMGVALPGKFPAEFAATYEEYIDWFIKIGEMNANTIRVYTILPPEFYQALSWYNMHYENRKLYLMQGVWAKEPPNDNYADPAYTRDFLNEIKDAVDVIHGNAFIEPVPGHAHGVYAYDVSRYTIGWMLGREWEPYAVTKTNQNDNVNLPYGFFVNVINASPMEEWLAGVMEFTVRYETQYYQAQRPVSFVNWLPLDPLYHNSEFIESEDVKEFDNDLEDIDMEKFSATHHFKPGVFASYHIYPYYPDFVFQEEKYRNTKNHHGDMDNYLAYLIDLKKNQVGMPIIVAEYGVPSSRGNSHYTPFGYHQGGYSEKEQADVSVLMTENIHRTAYAGALYFAWIDEWFKKNWLVMDFERPIHRRKKWHNMENPEQNYGILALESRKYELDGNPGKWGKKLEKPFVVTDYDEAYFYLAAYMPDVNFDKHNFYIAFDTYDKNKGSFRLPFHTKPLKRGVEFLLSVKNKNDAQLLVDQYYDIFTDRAKGIVPTYRSQKNDEGVFVEQLLLANRKRTDLLGDTFPEVRHNRGALIFGKSGEAETSNANIYWKDNGFFELRLPWQILNVTDPSSRAVLHGNIDTGEPDYVHTDGFHLQFYVTDKNNRPVNIYPNNQSTFFRWNTWDTPGYKSRLKPVYYALAELFKDMKPKQISCTLDIPADHNFSLTAYYRGHQGAISIAMDGKCYSQYSNVRPILEKYRLKATFAEASYTPVRSGATQYRMMLSNELEKIRQQAHEIRSDQHWIDYDASNNYFNAFPLLTPQPLVKVTNENTPGIHYIDSLLRKAAGKWTVFLVRHIYKPGSEAHANLMRLAGSDAPNISPLFFERLLRLSRNTGFWVAPISEIATYIHIRNNARLNFEKIDNRYFITVSHNMSYSFNKYPVTVKYEGPGNLIRVEGSATDGIHKVRRGQLFIDVYPNTKTSIEILE